MTIIWLLKLMRPYWKWILLSVVLSTATITSGIGLIGTSTYLISKASLQPSIAELQIAIVGVRFFGISRGVFRYLERLVSHSVNLKILSALRRWLYDKLEPLSPAFLQQKQSGDLLNQATMDIDKLENFFVRVFSPIIVAILVTTGMGLYVGMAHGDFSIILITGLIIHGVFIPLFSRLFRLGKQANLSKQHGELSAYLTENIQGVRDILVFNMDTLRQQRMAALSGQLEATQKKHVILESITDSLLQLIPHLTLLAAIIAAVPLVLRGDLKGIMFGVILLMILTSFEAVQPLGSAAQNLEQSMQAAERLLLINAEKPQVTTPENPAPLYMNPSIQFNQLSFRYPGRYRFALRSIDFKINPGEKYCLIGASGAGKSTIFNLLFRFWETQPEKILLNGVNIQNFDPEEIRSLLAVVSQDSTFISGSIKKNLLLARPDASDDEIYRALTQVRLAEWVGQLPKRLDTWIGEHGLRISGGEFTRLLIARALLRASPIWILDEPTAHLDKAAERSIVQLLHEVTRANTAIWATHRLIEMEKFDSILVLENGQIIERGNHTTLKTSGCAYQQFWESNKYL